MAGNPAVVGALESPWQPVRCLYIPSHLLGAFYIDNADRLVFINRFSSHVNAMHMKHNTHHGVRSANILAKYAKLSASVYRWLAIMPRWFMLVITGTIASAILGSSCNG
jgi:hypothetical protein